MRTAEFGLLISATIALCATGCSGTFALNLNPAAPLEKAAADAEHRQRDESSVTATQRPPLEEGDFSGDAADESPRSLDSLLESVGPAPDLYAPAAPAPDPPPATKALQNDLSLSEASGDFEPYPIPPAPLPNPLSLAALPSDGLPIAGWPTAAVGSGEVGPIPPAVVPAARIEKTPPPAEPKKPWREHLSGAIAALEAELAGPAEESDQRARLEAQLRLLYLASDRPEKAFRWIDELDSNEQDYVVNLLESWHSFFDPQGPPDSKARAALAQRALRNAGSYLAAASKLDLRNLTFCQRVDGYGQYEEFERTAGQHQFKPNQEVLLYVEVENFTAAETKDGLFETELQGSYYITPLDGSARLDDQPLPLDKQASRRFRRDYYLPYRIYLPKEIQRGQYLLQLQIKDVKGEKFGHGSIEFAIR